MPAVTRNLSLAPRVSDHVRGALTLTILKQTTWLSEHLDLELIKGRQLKNHALLIGLFSVHGPARSRRQ